MTEFLEVFESLRWMLVGMYLCIAGGICLLLVFMYTFITHFLMNDIEAARDAPCIFCPIRTLDVEKCNRIYLSPLSPLACWKGSL
jgi:hypothetical protein